jgi:excinuclease UvrABC nuclease subunit
MDKHDIAYKNYHKVEFLFDIQAWESTINCELEWTNIQFSRNCQTSIPSSPGIYAFVVEPKLFSLDPANGFFYIGKSKNLKKRIRSYIHEINLDFERTKRPHIWKMINVWENRLRYYYSVTATEEEAIRIENEIIKALYPPFNKRYDAETSRIVRAF